MFCTNLQGLLKPMYDLTGKGRPFILTSIQQKSFPKIKRLLKPPALYLPNNKDIFQHLVTLVKHLVVWHLIQRENQNLLFMLVKE